MFCRGLWVVFVTRDLWHVVSEGVRSGIRGRLSGIREKVVTAKSL